MKTLKNKIGLLLTMALLSHDVLAGTTMRDIKGAWLGTMQIPEGPSLRVGVEVFKKADGSWGGNVASLDQGARYMSVSKVSIENDVFTLTLANAPISISGKVDSTHKSIDTTFKQGSHGFDLLLHRVSELPENTRPQTPTSTQGYDVREVSYQNSTDETWLSGTLTIPKEETKRHPAIVLVAGSGPHHRDSYYSGHRMFKVLADHLTRLGFVVLRSDKRGVYKSTGNFADASIENLITDTEAAIQFLKSHPRVDASDITMIGHSEGSLVSVVAANRENIDKIVSLAGPGMSVLDILLLQDQTEPAAKGATAEETALLLEFSKRFYAMVLSTPSAEARKIKAIEMYDSLRGYEAEVVAKWVNKRNGTLSIGSAGSETFYHFLQRNPLDHWTKFVGSALILNGNKDSQVPAKENVLGIMGALDGSATVESHIMSNLNHLFQPAVTGANNEYGTIETTIDEQALKVISDWLQQR